jgi:hypothetical protein
MSIQYKPSPKDEEEYDWRTRLMIRGIKDGRVDLAANSGDLKDLDAKMAKEGEP